MEKKDLSIANEKRSAGVDLSDENLSIAYAKLRDEGDPTAFLLATFSNNKVTFASSGNTCDELIARLTDSDIYFGVIRATVSGRVKFFTFSFFGSDTNGMKKGKASLAKSGVLNFFEGIHGEIAICERVYDISKDIIVQKIASISRESDVSVS